MVSLSQAFKISLGSIRGSKMRSSLTTLGIIIGVAAVVANVSLGASFNQHFTDELGTLGSNFIIIFSQDINVLTQNQLEVIKNTPGVEGVSPINDQLAEVIYISASRQIELQGVTEDYEQVANIIMAEGNFLTDKDRFVAVIGHDVAFEKFDQNVSNKNSIDVTLKRRDGGVVTHKFKIKGIMQSRETTFVQGGPDLDQRILIPIETMNEILGVNDFGGFIANTGSAESVREVSEEIDKRLARNLGVPERDLENEDAKPYEVFNQADILELLDQLADALSTLLTSVALISLVVGSIGIMNIMLVTVTERTREIGLMKAVGYTYFDILSLFIVESVVLGLLGGVLGTGLGLVGSYLVEKFLVLPHVFPVSFIFLGFGVSVIVGLIAGVYPANKAARMDPVEALRHH